MTDLRPMMEIESQRACRVIEAALREIGEDGGSIRFFAIANLDAAVALFVAQEGGDVLLHTLAKMASAHEIESGMAGRA